VNAQPTTNFCIEVNDAAVGGIGIGLGQDVNRHTVTLGYWPGEKFWGSGKSPRRCLRTILHPHACLKKQVSFSKPV